MADLCFQERLRTSDFILKNVPGANNPSDLLTKHMIPKTVDMHLGALHIASVAVRSNLAPQLT